MTISIGDRFGRWLVMARSRSPMFLCRCDCGVEKQVHRTSLLSGRSSSCGCFSVERATALATTHGGTGTALHGLWRSMRDRCRRDDDPRITSIYKSRGIVVDPRWDDFEAFRDWAISHGYESGLQIDREDNDGPYSPDNCRFVTCMVNNNNRRDNVLLTAFGRTLTMAEWSREPECVVPYTALSLRITRYGWSAEKALTIPPKVGRHLSSEIHT